MTTDTAYHSFHCQLFTNTNDCIFPCLILFLNFRWCI